ncbi:amidohydrolase family protein [Sphingopyxis sp.]|uniref:amidohydrolase family protein n=1 Tax=Sphingopyxis sp. TaxID=1908224 RepID=UPI0035B2B172
MQTIYNRLVRTSLAAAACTLALWAATGQTAPAKESADLLIDGGTIITMDPARRIIDDGAVAILGNRIVAIGTSAELQQRFHAREVIDAHRKIVMPGLIDGHGHAGHAMLKSLDADGEDWNAAVERLYAHGSTPDFWKADAELAGLERLKGGVTTSVNLFGGGADVYRVDDPKYADAYLGAIRDIGVRWFLGVGPRRGPFPSAFTDWTSGKPHAIKVDFAQQLGVSEALIRKWDKAGDGRIRMATVFPTIAAKDAPPGAVLDEIKREARAVRDLSKRAGVLFLQDGHTKGTVQFANDELGLLGPDAIFSHATDLTDQEIRLIASTGTRISHNPSAIFSIMGRNPTTELIDAGAIVMLGSDGAAPDRSYDMFRHMFQATRYHRRHFRDPDVLPAGKVLEMVTIDAARAIGMEKEIGSLEAGKRADIILIDWFKPRLMPMNMPVHRVVYYANGEDVATVLVDGRVLMRDRKVLTVDEGAALSFAQGEIDSALTRAELGDLTVLPKGFWGSTHLIR